MLHIAFSLTALSPTLCRILRNFVFVYFSWGFFSPFLFSWSHVTAQCSAFSGTFWWPLSVTLRRHPGVKSALLVSLVDRHRCCLAGKRANISDDSNGETTAADSWAASRVEISPNPPSFDARHETREWRRLVQGQEIWSRGTSIPLGFSIYSFSKTSVTMGGY